MIKKWIEVSIQHEGVHRYQEALTDKLLKDVSFLGYPHRHVFYIYVRIGVTHSNRELEFLQVKKKIKQYLESLGSDFDYKSCEMIGEMIVDFITIQYGGQREIEVRVYEDNENGAVILYTP